MMIENGQKKRLDIIVVNNNYEKMAARKKAILEANNAAIKTNKKITKAKKTNTVLTLIFAALFSIAAGVAIWLFVKIGIFGLPLVHTKVILAAVIAILTFIIFECASFSYKNKLNKKKKTVVAIDESITFSTLLKGKYIDSYSVTTYKEIPYETQKVYLTLKLDDNGKATEYTCIEKWSLVLLPMLFDVIIDAENTTIYLPYEKESEDNHVRNRIKEQINAEQINIEREAKEEAEKKLATLRVEKEAVERVLMKSNEEIFGLKKQLNETNNLLTTYDSRYSTEKTGLLAIIDNQKEEKSNVDSQLAEAQKSLAEKEKTEIELKDRISCLEAENEKMKSDSSGVNELHEKSIKELQEAHEKNTKELQETHKKEIASLKEQFAIAAQDAKNTLVNKYETQIQSLKDENSKLVSTEEYNEIKDALQKESEQKIAREKEVSFEKEKIKTLEAKIQENNSAFNNAIKKSEEEKENLRQELAEQKQLLEKTKEAEASAIASAGVQERALIKENDELKQKNKDLKKEIESLKPLSSVKEENEELKKQLASAKNEDIEAVKKDYSERYSLLKEERDKMEKKMREALEASAKEKAERIKAEETLKKWIAEEKQAEHEKKIQAHEAEIAKAREMAEKAQQDAKKANETESKKKPTRKLIY